MVLVLDNSEDSTPPKGDADLPEPPHSAIPLNSSMQDHEKSGPNGDAEQVGNHQGSSQQNELPLETLNLPISFFV